MDAKVIRCHDSNDEIKFEQRNTTPGGVFCLMASDVRLST
jgi:hypothetical protein